MKIIAYSLQFAVSKFKWIYCLLFILFTIHCSLSPVLAAPINFGAKQPFGIRASEQPSIIISNVVRILFIVAALGVVVMVVWGGLDWVLSGGDKEKVASARKKITTAFVGLAILSLSYFFISLFGGIVGFDPLQNFIVNPIGTSVNSTQQPPAAVPQTP
jgi:hypothetical protein